MATWTPTEKTRALEAYAEHGAAVAYRLTGVPKRTITYWAKQAGVTPPTVAEEYEKAGEHLTKWTEERLSEMRLDLRGKLLRAASRTVDRMDEPYEEFIGPAAREVAYDLPPGSVIRDFAVAAGILIDKYRLESGEASAVFGSVDVLPKLDDHEKAALAEVLREAIREKADEASATVSG